MGEHSKPRKAYDAAFMAVYRSALWVGKHRRKIYAVAVVVIPLAARYMPDFPADALLDAARVFLGA
jgi:hypothetical protein